MKQGSDRRRRSLLLRAKGGSDGDHARSVSKQKRRPSRIRRLVWKETVDLGGLPGRRPRGSRSSSFSTATPSPAWTPPSPGERQSAHLLTIGLTPSEQAEAPGAAPQNRYSQVPRCGVARPRLMQQSGRSYCFAPRAGTPLCSCLWAKPGAAEVCSTLAMEQATTWRCICTLWKTAAAESPSATATSPVERSSRRRSLAASPRATC